MYPKRYTPLCKKKSRTHARTHASHTQPRLSSRLFESEINCMLVQDAHRDTDMDLGRQSHELLQPPVQPGCHVRIEGLLTAVAMNDRHGVVCDDFDAGTGRWTVNVAATASQPATKGQFRAVNLKVIHTKVLPLCTAAHAAALLQRAQSSGDLEAQKAALHEFCLVITNDPGIQSTAGEDSAMAILLELAESSGIAASAAQCLEQLLSGSHANERRFYSAVCSSKQVPRAVEGLVTKVRKVFEESAVEHSLLRQLNDWCDEAKDYIPDAASDELPTVSTAATQQLGDSCFIFAAVRSFNRR